MRHSCASPGWRPSTIAARRPPAFHLHPERIGDLVVLGDRDTVFGPLDRATEDLPPEFRTHGSLHESAVPLIVSGVPIAADQWQACRHNVDLTRVIELPTARLATSGA